LNVKYNNSLIIFEKTKKIAMAEIIRMPRLSDTMEEGNIVKWLKKEGDTVAPGDILAEVETDKATMDLESFHNGILLHIGINEGPVAVDGIIAIIGEKGEDVEKLLAEANKESEATPAEEEGKEIDEEETKEEVKEQTKKEAKKDASSSKETGPVKPDTNKAPAASTAEGGRIKASPLAKKMATDKGIDLGSVIGTGEEGRIVKKDIENYVPLTTSGNKAPAAANSDERTSNKTTESPTIAYGDHPVSQMRKTIAKRLGESKFTAPHFYLTIVVDMKEAMRARKAINEEEGVKVSYNDLIVKASAYSLKKHRKVNASWLEDKITVHQRINIGVAVAVDEGLVVPVLHDTDGMSLMQINNQVKSLAGKARSKKIQPKEMQGNTFTISNLGMFGIDEFTAIINPPDACILAVGGIQELPVVKDGEIKIGHQMKVTLSCDHRIVDGATGAKFLQTLKFVLENPVRLLV